MGNQLKKITKETRKHLIQQARYFRQNPTKAEAILWGALRDRELGGYKFKRQRVFGPFILDFYCPVCRLAIELDGEIHRQQQEYDTQRTERLKSYGVTVMRFANQDIIQETERVLEEIMEMCKKLSS
jgi:very-short-patch-repair endonuclease